MNAIAQASAALVAGSAVPPGPKRAGVLAFDFGVKYIGVAVGDSETGIANPLEIIASEDNATRFGRIEGLIAEWSPGSLVVGLPLAMDGSEHDLTRRARRFANQLEGRFRLPVALVDERLSSAVAEDALRDMGRGGRAHKHDSHALAAQIILQAWLDGQRRLQPAGGADDPTAGDGSGEPDAAA
jgi:putative Holliday junction resolvase